MSSKKLESQRKKKREREGDRIQQEKRLQIREARKGE
jgi:hypothetical protein